MNTTAREYVRLRNAVFALSFLAWLVLLRPLPTPVATGAGEAGGPPSVSWCGTAMPLLVARPAVSAKPAGPQPGLAPAQAWTQAWVAALTWAWAGGWVLMLGAMMLPTLVQPLYHIHLGSFSRRRGRAAALFLAGYGAVWLAVGGGLRALALAAHASGAPAYLLVAGAGLGALVWQASPLKQCCLNRCHRHRPLAAFGLRADWDALRMGLTHGGWCTGSCWVVMLLPPLLGHGHLWAMAAVSLLMFCERLDPPGPLAWRWRGFATARCYVRLYLWGPRRSLVPSSILVQA